MRHAKREVGPIRALFLLVKNLFLFACVLVAIFGIVGYASGWIRFDHREHSDQTTIEIDTAEMRNSAQEAIDEGKELIDKARNKIDDVGEPDEGETVPAGKRVEPDEGHQTSDESAEVI